MCTFVPLQEYDLSQLHRGLDNRPEVFHREVVPAAQKHSLYRLQPQENEDIGNFIKDVCSIIFYSYIQYQREILYFILHYNYLTTLSEV